MSQSYASSLTTASPMAIEVPEDKHKEQEVAERVVDVGKENDENDPVPTPTGWRKIVLVTILCGAQFFDIFTACSAIAALPTIGEKLGFTAGQLPWVLSAYTLTFGAFQVPAGRLSDIYHPKPVFCIGFFCVGLFSVLCAVSVQPIMLLVFRAMCGLCAAMTVPSAMSILVQTFRDPKEQSDILGIFGASGAVGNCVGLVIGGVLSAKASWRWLIEVFQDLWQWSALSAAVHSIPIGVSGGLSAWLTGVHGHRVPKRLLLVVGQLFMIVGAVLFALSKEPEHYWPYIFPGMIVGIFGLSMAYVGSNVTTMSGARKGEEGVVGAVLYTSYQIGSTLGIAVSTAVTLGKNSHALVGGSLPGAPPSLLFRAIDALPRASLQMAARDNDRALTSPTSIMTAKEAFISLGRLPNLASSFLAADSTFKLQTLTTVGLLVVHNLTLASIFSNSEMDTDATLWVTGLMVVQLSPLRSSERTDMETSDGTPRPSDITHVPVNIYICVIDELQAAKRRSRTLEAEKHTLLEQVARLERQVNSLREVLRRIPVELRANCVRGEDGGREEVLDGRPGRARVSGRSHSRSVSASSSESSLEGPGEGHIPQGEPRTQTYDNANGEDEPDNSPRDPPTRVNRFTDDATVPTTHSRRTRRWQTTIRRVVSRGTATIRRVSGGRSPPTAPHQTVPSSAAFELSILSNPLPERPVATALPPCIPNHVHEWGLKGSNKSMRKYTCKHCKLWVQEKPDDDRGCWISFKFGHSS
ncbi:hypothetical protein NM688_g4188 [Phlebia brevispora]|uniref:Uncharacterized protein n=1 Tax=Phlebia brevispora TaxID=194682 RepID=A0ACC1T3C8_9APHY|nr:hypothetical protein NM688_g4188 [Phlebia brevispora]